MNDSGIVKFQSARIVLTPMRDFCHRKKPVLGIESGMYVYGFWKVKGNRDRSREDLLSSRGELA
jgi:hypothetical protein